MTHRKILYIQIGLYTKSSLLSITLFYFDRKIFFSLRMVHSGFMSVSATASILLRISVILEMVSHSVSIELPLILTET